MLESLGLYLIGLFCLGAILAMVVINIRDRRTPKKEPQPPLGVMGSFTRPSAPANPGPIEYNRTNHTHMRSGTIYENRNPENEGLLRVRTTRISTSLGENASLQRALQEALIRPSPAAPGVVVRVTTTEEISGVSPGQIANEKRILAKMLGGRKSEGATTPVKRVSRYKRKPVI